MIHTLLVEPDRLLGKLFYEFLDRYPEIVCAGVASDGQTALSVCRTMQPDVVILEVLLPDCDGVAVLHTIREQYPETVVLVFSSYLEAYVDAMQAGAAVWVSKGAGIDDLVDAIHQHGKHLADSDMQTQYVPVSHEHLAAPL